MIFIVSRVIDLIGEGGYAGKGFMIITKRPDQLAKAINDDLGRGVTFISGQGYYSQKDLKIIYCIVGRNEIVKMKEMIHRIDPQAFITITEAHEILGEGFTFEKNKRGLVVTSKVRLNLLSLGYRQPLFCLLNFLRPIPSYFFICL